MNTPTNQVLLLFQITLFFSLTMAVRLSSTVEDEAHKIVKRFADVDKEFHSHGIAEVLFEENPETLRRISKRDLERVTETDGEIKTIRLEHSSGSRIKLNLKKRSLFGKDTDFMEHTEQGYVKREAPVPDCFAVGDAEIDGKRGGIASVSLCDGMHGTIMDGDGMEYYIHPVESDGFEHKVHVLSRRSTKNLNGQFVRLEDEVEYSTESQKSKNVNSVTRIKRSAVNAETYKTATSFVIEMALFTDSQYYEQVTKIAPGREDEYILVAFAATNAIYSDPQKVGYDASIKIKSYVIWKVNPEDYVFEQDLERNLRSFCKATQHKYFYDLHFVNTGVTHERGPAVGFAYVGGICKNWRCASTYAVSIGRAYLIAHEIGHTLGFKHHSNADCPPEIKSQGAGFMGGSDLLNFVPCNKWELNHFFSKGHGQCLFEETTKTDAPEKAVNLPKVLPGQYFTPDEQCQLLAGDDFRFFRPEDLRGDGECKLPMCINMNSESPGYLSTKKIKGLTGFTCGDEMWCKGLTCGSWKNPKVGMNINYFRENKQNNTWSEWDENWSECSNECGIGVQTKRRTCHISAPFLTPYCRGPSVKVRGCNRTPCTGPKQSYKSDRQAKGDEICKNLYSNGVQLPVRKNTTYLPKSKNVYLTGSWGGYLKTVSCMFQCVRSPYWWSPIDGIFPDGTPCTRPDKSDYTRKRFGIELRCAQGACVEISDCEENAVKDDCGICGGTPKTCKSNRFDQKNDVEQGGNLVLATIPAGSTMIDIRMDYWKQYGVYLQVVNAETGEKIFGFGAEGKFAKKWYRSGKGVDYAGSSWLYAYSAFVRTDGPITNGVIVQAVRGKRPIKEIHVVYLLPNSENEDAV